MAKTIQGILGLPPEGSLPPQAPDSQRVLCRRRRSTSRPRRPSADARSSQPARRSALPAEALAKGLTVRAYKPTNSIFIRYYENDLERIERLIKEQLDIPLPQVQIAATMVITTQNALDQIGVQWGGGVDREDRRRAGARGGGLRACSPRSGTAGNRRLRGSL